MIYNIIPCSKIQVKHIKPFIKIQWLQKLTEINVYIFLVHNNIVEINRQTYHFKSSEKCSNILNNFNSVLDKRQTIDLFYLLVHTQLAIG